MDRKVEYLTQPPKRLLRERPTVLLQFFLAFSLVSLKDILRIAAMDTARIRFLRGFGGRAFQDAPKWQPSTHPDKTRQPAASAMLP